MNVGRAAPLVWQGVTIRTGFIKRPVAGPVRVLSDHLDGDEQADRTVHGGPRKAIYAYGADHYRWWTTELPGVALPWGSFGENLSIAGLVESEIRVGDRWRAGSSVLEVTQPRGPCVKLNARFGRDDMIDRLWRSGRSGFYLGILKEGTVAAGDPFELLTPSEGGRTIAQELEIRRRKAQAASAPE